MAFSTSQISIVLATICSLACANVPGMLGAGAPMMGAGAGGPDPSLFANLLSTQPAAPTGAGPDLSSLLAPQAQPLAQPMANPMVPTSTGFASTSFGQPPQDQFPTFGGAGMGTGMPGMGMPAMPQPLPQPRRNPMSMAFPMMMMSGMDMNPLMFLFSGMLGGGGMFGSGSGGGGMGGMHPFLLMRMLGNM